jgi:hypothetical protein
MGHGMRGETDTHEPLLARCLRPASCEPWPGLHNAFTMRFACGSGSSGLRLGYPQDLDGSWPVVQCVFTLHQIGTGRGLRRMGDNETRHITQRYSKVAGRVALGRWMVAECNPTSRQILKAGFGDSVAAASQALASQGTPTPTEISTRGGSPNRTEARRPDPNPAWRSDPRWISELPRLNTAFQANGALLPPVMDEVEEACESPTVSIAYENGWADIVSFIVFWEALATRGSTIK